MEDIKAGSLTLRPIHTPGHTPEHTSYLVLIEGEPVALFSGGSLLVASAGRPDLLGTARARTPGQLQYGSLHRLAGLPRHVALYPTHGEGSSCAATDAGKYTSTIGDEVDTNPMLAVGDPEQFADQLLADPLPIPSFYQYMGPANTLGVPPMPPVTVPELAVTEVPEDAPGRRRPPAHRAGERTATRLSRHRARRRLRKLGRAGCCPTGRRSSWSPSRVRT